MNLEKAMRKAGASSVTILRFQRWQRRYFSDELYDDDFVRDMCRQKIHLRKTRRREKALTEKIQEFQGQVDEKQIQQWQYELASLEGERQSQEREWCQCYKLCAPALQRGIDAL